MPNFDSSLPVLDVNQTQTQLKIANVSDQTHIRHIDQGIIQFRYDKATVGSENIKRCQILTPLISISDVDQTQTQLKIVNINQGILPVPYDKATAGSVNIEQCQIFTPLILNPKFYSSQTGFGH